MENNQTIHHSENLAAQDDDGSHGPPDKIVVPAAAEYDSNVLHLSLGDKSVYLEKPFLLGGEFLKTATEQVKKGCFDRKCTINGITKSKHKRGRHSVITRQKTNLASKKLKRGFRNKGFNYPTDLLKAKESNILFNIQINKCTVLPTPSKRVDNQKSSEAAQDYRKDGPKVDQIASLKLASSVIRQDTSTSDTGSASVYEGKHYNRNASNISAAVSVLDEVVEKFTALTIYEEKETNMADTDMNVEQKDRLQTSPNNTLHKLHENARPKNVLTDIKTIKESVSKSLSLCSSSKFSLAEKAEAVHAPEVESACSGNETVKQANEIKSGKILSDIKFLKEMLVKSLAKGPCEEARVVSDRGRDGTPDTVKDEKPGYVTEPKCNAVIEHLREDVDTDKIPEDGEMFGRMNISDSERVEPLYMPNNAIPCEGIKPETGGNVGRPNTTGEIPVAFHNEKDATISGSMTISDRRREEMPDVLNNAMPVGGIEPETTTGDERIGENVNTQNTADETTAIIHDEDDKEFSGIMQIYKNSHIHDGMINSASIKNAETKDYGYQYFSLSNL